jgi:hypothetical protein
MKRSIIYFGLLLFCGALISCDKGKDPVPVVNPYIIFTATLNGTSEVPANPSTATGSATLNFNTTTKIFSVTVTYSGFTSTAAHIHKGATNANGGVIFGFTPFASPIIYTSVALDAAQEADLMTNQYYVNVHSAAYPGGEVRGQLIRQ